MRRNYLYFRIGGPRVEGLLRWSIYTAAVFHHWGEVAIEGGVLARRWLGSYLFHAMAKLQVENKERERRTALVSMPLSNTINFE